MYLYVCGLMQSCMTSVLSMADIPEPEVTESTKPETPIEGETVSPRPASTLSETTPSLSESSGVGPEPVILIEDPPSLVPDVKPPSPAG